MKRCTRLQKTVELDSNFWVDPSYAGKSLYPAAKISRRPSRSSRKARELSRRKFGADCDRIGYATALSGDKAKGRAVLEELKSLASQRYIPPSNLALLSYVLGEKDEAFSWLEKAYQDRDIRLCRLKVDSRWDSIRSEPAFRRNPQAHWPPVATKWGQLP